MHSHPSETSDSPPRGKTYLTINQVRARFGNCSKMWIERRAADGFPAPSFYVGGRRLWSLDSIEAWERSRPSGPPAWLTAAGEKGKAAARLGRAAMAAKRPEQHAPPQAPPVCKGRRRPPPTQTQAVE